MYNMCTRAKGFDQFLPRTDTEARADPLITFLGSCSSTSSVKASPVHGTKREQKREKKDVIQIEVTAIQWIMNGDTSASQWDQCQWNVALS